MDESTTEPELVAGALTMRGAVLCSNKTMELSFNGDFKGVPLHIDNTSALHVAGNQTSSSTTKHVALRYFCIHEVIKEGHVGILYIPEEARGSGNEVSQRTEFPGVNRGPEHVTSST